MLIKAYVKYILLLLLGVLLTVSTAVLGALPMFVVRRGFGRSAFWLGQIAVAGALAASGMLPYGVLVFAMALMVGVYVEVEEHGSSIFLSAAAATLAALGTVLLAAGTWFYKTNGHLVVETRQQVTLLLEKLNEMNANANIDVETVLQQLPSALVIGFVAALGIALIAEKRVGHWFGFRPAKASARLSTFRVPDFMTWFVIVAIAAAFIRHGNEFVQIMGLNLVNALVLVYFFQGLAVISQAFTVFKVSPLWRRLWYILLVMQLFLVVAFVGLVDYWADFRERMARKKTAETNNGFKT